MRKEKEVVKGFLDVHNVEAEKALLGVCLANNDNVMKVSDYITADDFYVPIHRKIYSLIQDFLARDLTADPVTLKSYLKDTDDKEAVSDNYEYLLQLYKNAITVTGVETYAKEIHECYLKRKLVEISQELIDKAYDKATINISSKEMLEDAEQKIYSLATSREDRQGFVHLKSGVASVLNHLVELKKGTKKAYGVTSGFEDLDRILGGLQPSDLLILAARPSMGKTSLAINIAMKAAQELAKEGKSVAFFSLEMSTEQIATRMLSINSGFSSSRIRAGEFESKKDFEKLCLVARELNDIPLYIDDTPAITIASLKSKARRLKRQHNLGLLVVDYLQLMRGTSSGENRVQEIGEISQGLKAIAKELNIPVIALSQLSRAVESREDKRPMLSDLRESGNIEQDADIVMFLYREEYYLLRKEPHLNDDAHSGWLAELDKVKNIADVIISKQRNGAIGVVSLHFNSHTTGFANLQKE